MNKCLKVMKSALEFYKDILERHGGKKVSARDTTPKLGA
jgi:hypothetical protein